MDLNQIENRIERNWNQLNGQVKATAGNRTDDNLNKTGGRREQLESESRERHRSGCSALATSTTRFRRRGLHESVIARFRRRNWVRRI